MRFMTNVYYVKFKRQKHRFTSLLSRLLLVLLENKVHRELDGEVNALPSSMYVLIPWLRRNVLQIDLQLLAALPLVGRKLVDGVNFFWQPVGAVEHHAVTLHAIFG